MKYLLLLVVFWSVLTPFGTAQKMEDASLEKLTAFCKQFPEKTELSIALIKGNKVEYYGLRRLIEKAEYIENKTAIYEIGSISKVFTSTLLMYAVKEKKVNLEKPIKKYLKIKYKDKQAITLTQLANHSSGLPRLPENIFPYLSKNPENPYKEYDENALLSYLKEDMKLNAKPGNQYEYSNLGVGLLAYILTQVEEKSYEQLLQERIFKPLNMKHSSTMRSSFTSKVVVPLDSKGGKGTYWDFGVLGGAGAIYSTVKDLAKYVQVNFGEDAVLRKQQTKTSTVSKQMDMGYGWHIIQADAKTKLYFHNGGTGGYTSFMAFDRVSQSGVVILSNISAFHPKSSELDAVGFQLLKELVD